MHHASHTKYTKCTKGAVQVPRVGDKLEVNKCVGRSVVEDVLVTKCDKVFVDDVCVCEENVLTKCGDRTV